MTTIAWDGTTLASDSLLIAGGSKRRIHKIHKVPCGYFACAGTVEGGLMILDWINRGEDPTDRPNIPDLYAAYGVIVERDWNREVTVRLIENACKPFPMLESFTAVGSGRDLAIGAMRCGKNAMEAVAIAAEFDAQTGGEIISVIP